MPRSEIALRECMCGSWSWQGEERANTIPVLMEWISLSGIKHLLTYTQKQGVCRSNKPERRQHPPTESVCREPSCMLRGLCWWNSAILQTGSGRSSWVTGVCWGCRCVRCDTETDEREHTEGTQSRTEGLGGPMASVNHPESNMWAHWGKPTRAMPQQWPGSWQMFCSLTSGA